MIIEGKVISVLNMKGGVGKTTITKEVGYHLAHSRDKRVLLIDVDPQLNLTQSLFRLYGFAQTEELAHQIKEEQDAIGAESDGSPIVSLDLKISKATIENVFNSSISSPATEENAIQELSTNLAVVPGELGIEFTLRNLNSGKIENGIYDFIEKNSLKQKYDYIIIDCPPTYSSYTIAALKPSDYILIPVKPEAYSITGANMLMNVVNAVIDDNSLYFKDKPLKKLGIIYTDIRQNPSKGTLNLIKDITNSNELSKHDLYFFSTHFLSNAYMKNKLDYFIDISNSQKSKQNLETLVDEVLGRIDDLG